MRSSTIFATAAVTPQKAGPAHIIAHPLGGGFYLEEAKAPCGGTALTVRCARTKEARPNVLENAVGMDFTGDTLLREWLPDNMDVLARLRTITGYKGNTATHTA